MPEERTIPPVTQSPLSQTQHTTALAHPWRKTPMDKSTGGSEVVVCWLLNVPATGECISWTDLLRQFYVLPH